MRARQLSIAMQDEGEGMRPSQESTRPLLGDVFRVGKQQDAEAPMRYNLCNKYN